MHQPSETMPNEETTPARDATDDTSSPQAPNSGQQTILVGRLFPLPRRRVLRALLNLVTRVEAPFAAARRPDSALCNSLGNTVTPNIASATTTVIPASAADDPGAPAPNIHDALAASVDVSRSLVDVAGDQAKFPALHYRGVNLPDVFQHDLLMVMSKVYLVRRQIADSVDAAKNARLVVENAATLEWTLCQALAQEGRCEVAPHPVLPRWFAGIEGRVLRAFVMGYTLFKASRFRCEIFEVEPAAGVTAAPAPRPVMFFSMGTVSTRATLPVLVHLVRNSGQPLAIALPSTLATEVAHRVEDAGGRIRTKRTVRPAPLLRLIRHSAGLRRFRRDVKRTGVSFCGASMDRILTKSNSLFSDVTVSFIKSWADGWAPEVAALRPAILFSGNEFDWKFKVVAALAERGGTQTAGLLDGIFVDLPTLANSACQHVFVGGPGTRENMGRMGVPLQRIHAMGLPHYDRVLNEPRRDRADVCGDLELNPALPIILFITHHSTFIDEKKEEVSAVLDIAASRPDWQVVFKLHPHERDGVVQALVNGRDKPANVRVCQAYDTFDLLAASQVVVLRVSTVGTEAMVFGTPVIVLNLSGRRDDLPYVEHGAAVSVSTEEALGKALGDLLDDGANTSTMAENAKQFVAQYFGPVDGEAARRICEYILSIEGASDRATAPAEHGA